MTLRPGDRSIRAVLRPVFPHGLAERGRWPCSNCHRRFDAMLTCAVLYARPQQAVPYAFMVCPTCADALAPVRLTVDRHRLGAYLAARSTRNGSDRVARAVADRLACVLAMRQNRGRPPGTVQLRAAETHPLAERLDISPTDLVNHLRTLDVLTDVDSATRPVPAGPATAP